MTQKPQMNTTTSRRAPLLAALLSLTLCGALAGCGDDDDGAPDLGERCDGSLAPADACRSADAVCADDGAGELRCQRDLGAACPTSTDDEAHCLFGSACYAFPDVSTADPDDTVGRCATPEGGLCDPQAPFCAPELLCALLTDGTSECHEPVVLQGAVRDSATGGAIAGAHVIALDHNQVAVSDVAVTDAAGAYALWVPVVRDTDGVPVGDTAFTLRAAADSYQTFPFGIRTAIPILSSEAVHVDATPAAGEAPDPEAPGTWVIEGTLTAITLIALPDDGVERMTISGAVITGDGAGIDDDGAGVLVIARGGGDPAPSAVSDLGGDFTIFNVEPGSIEVRGYKAGLQLTPVTVEVAAEPLVDVHLEVAQTGTSSVSGSVNIVNAPGGSMTSVVLAVEDTFQDTFGRGEVPAGLRTALDVTGPFTIDDVPAGRYVVLAAFENDGLVRDPDTNIAGTATLIIDVVAGEDLVIGDAFKVTEALAVMAPGSTLPTAVTSAPTLTWADDSSEAYYTVQVFNALGELVFEDGDVPSVSGGGSVTVLYTGALVPGMYYQFRALSWRSPGGSDPAPISATEDLRGVFFVE